MENHVKVTRKLLSLGVRGMSTIAILRELMEKLALKCGVEEIHPWQEFDMIGGTSTGGLSAIMLGRLRMSIDDCEEAYMKFSKDIFTSSNLLSNSNNLSEKFDDKRDVFLKFSVSVVRQEDSANTVLRSYINLEMPNPMWRYCKIWEAARATSAASTFLEPITIGPNQQAYPEDDRVILSVGTGSAPGGNLEGNTLKVENRLKELLVETEKTAEGFLEDNQTVAAAHQYYRFNFYHGIGHIGLEEYKARPQIYAATATYLETMDVVTKKFDNLVTRIGSTPINPPNGKKSSSKAMAMVLPNGYINAPKPAAIPLAQQLKIRKQQAELSKKLLSAVNRINYAEVKKLLEEGANVNSPSELYIDGNRGKEIYPLYVAALRKHNEILKLLLQKGANVDAIGGGYCETALQAAVHSDNEEGVEELLMAGGNPNTLSRDRKQSPLQETASNNCFNLVETLILAGADVNEQLSSGSGPLQRALRFQNRQMIQILIEAGANVEDLSEFYRARADKFIAAH